MFQTAVKLVEPVTLPALTPSSTSQRRLCAGVVVMTVLTVPTLAVIVCVSGETPRIRGPRPPAGLTISAAWVISRVRASSCQRRRNVTRRKSSPFASAPAALGDAGVGGGCRRVAVGRAVEDARRCGDRVRRCRGARSSTACPSRGRATAVATSPTPGPRSRVRARPRRARAARFVAATRLLLVVVVCSAPLYIPSTASIPATSRSAATMTSIIVKPSSPRPGRAAVDEAAPATTSCRPGSRPGRAACRCARCRRGCGRS